MIDEMLKMNEAIQTLIIAIEERDNLRTLFKDYNLDFDYCRLMQEQAGQKDLFLKGLILGIIYERLNQTATE